MVSAKLQNISELTEPEPDDFEAKMEVKDSTQAKAANFIVMLSTTMNKSMVLNLHVVNPINEFRCTNECSVLEVKGT